MFGRPPTGGELAAEPGVDAFHFVQDLVLVMAEDAAGAQVLQLALGEHHLGCCQERATIEEDAVDVAGAHRLALDVVSDALEGRHGSDLVAQFFAQGMPRSGRG